MHERNTAGVGPILNKHGLATLPEAHCYLRFREHRVDVTREISAGPPEAIAEFLYEEEITPEQAGDYKKRIHREFLRRWIAENAKGGDLDDLWRVREECIAALCR
jgi:hypothetical protein